MSKMLQNIAKYIKIKNKTFPSEITFAEVLATVNSVELEVVGVPSVIQIEYSGSCQIIDAKIKAGIKKRVSNRKILINNPFAFPIPKVLFYYRGNFKIERFEIISFHGTRIKPSIIELQSIENVDKKNLNVEIDDSIILDRKKIPTKESYYGYKQTNISNFIIQDGIVQKYGKKEITNKNVNKKQDSKPRVNVENKKIMDNSKIKEQRIDKDVNLQEQDMSKYQEINIKNEDILRELDSSVSAPKETQDY